MNSMSLTEKQEPKLQTKSRENNFSVIRLTGAVFVFAGHMGLILGMQPPVLGSFPLHELGVMMLFLISGYLITQSWLSDPHPLRYAIRRFFRLWPPFAVMILIMVFVAGPLVSDLGIRGYFQSDYKYYLRNLCFWNVYSQPGVFTDLPMANITNGSLWTMFIEAGLYIVTPFLLTLLRVRDRSRLSFHLTAVLTGAAVLTDFLLRIFCSDTGLVICGMNLLTACHLAVMYLTGIFFTYEEVRKYLNLQAACIAMFLLLFGQALSAPLQYLVLYLVLPYSVFSFVFAPKPFFKNQGRRPDLSYGIYLYGFFFQQLVLFIQLKYDRILGYMGNFVISMLLTLMAALFSWYLVEKPMQRFCSFLIRRWER